MYDINYLGNYPSNLLKEQMTRMVYTCQGFKLPLNEFYTMINEKGIRITMKGLLKEIEESNLFHVSPCSIIIKSEILKILQFVDSAIF